ncbi:hypothetical protein [Rubripirellula tenax]|nr:hypothetical protein [Rubripirellula tenax]
MIPAVCILMTAAIGGGIYALRESIPIDRFIPVQSIVAAIPMMDSHEKVLNDYADNSEAAVAAIKALKEPEAVVDTKSIAKVIIELNDLNQQCSQLQKRAIALPPLSPSEWNRLMEWIARRLPEKGKEAESTAGVIRNASAERLASSPEFREAAVTFTLTSSDTRRLIESAWIPIPSATTPLQEIERGVIDAKRKVWAAVIAADDKDDADSIVDAYREAAEELTELASRYEDEGLKEQLFRVISPFYSNAHDIDPRMAIAFHRSLSGEIDLEGVPEVQRYDDVEARLKSFGRQTSPDFTPPEPGYPGSPMVPPYGPGSPGFGNPMTRGNEFRGNNGMMAFMEKRVEETITNIRNKHSADETVLLRIENRVDGPEGDKLIQSLRETLGIRRSMQFGFGNTGLVCLFDSGSLHRVADAITWADVSSIDSAERMIHLKIPPPKNVIEGALQ